MHHGRLATQWRLTCWIQDQWAVLMSPWKRDEFVMDSKAAVSLSLAWATSCGRAGGWLVVRVCWCKRSQRPSVAVRADRRGTFPLPLGSFGLRVLLLLKRQVCFKINQTLGVKSVGGWRTHRGTAGDALLLVVGGRSYSFPGTGRCGWSFPSRLWRFRLRVLVLLCQGEQVTESGRGKTLLKTCSFWWWRTCKKKIK